MRLGYLDVVAEYVVVADLEGGNSGPFTLARLKLCDYLACPRGEAAELIDLGAEPTPDYVSLAGIDRRFLADSRVDFFYQLRIR